MNTYIWGSTEIGKKIGLTERKARTALSQGHVPGAVKIGGKWCFCPETFNKAFLPSNENGK